MKDRKAMAKAMARGKVLQRIGTKATAYFDPGSPFRSPFVYRTGTGRLYELTWEHPEQWEVQRERANRIPQFRVIADPVRLVKVLIAMDYTPGPVEWTCPERGIVFRHSMLKECGRKVWWNERSGKYQTADFWYLPEWVEEVPE